MRYRDFPIGVVNNPLVKNIFAGDSDNDGGINPPGNSRMIATENLVAITTEDNIILITEG